MPRKLWAASRPIPVSGTTSTGRPQSSTEAPTSLHWSATRPRRGSAPRLDGREAYIVAGSFVRYLIETYGMERFRKLYALTPLVPRSRDPGDPARWQTVYGKPLAALAEGWRLALER